MIYRRLVLVFENISLSRLLTDLHQTDRKRRWCWKLVYHFSREVDFSSSSARLLWQLDSNYNGFISSPKNLKVGFGGFQSLWCLSVNLIELKGVICRQSGTVSWCGNDRLCASLLTIFWREHETWIRRGGNSSAPPRYFYHRDKKIQKKGCSKTQATVALERVLELSLSS